MKVQDVGSSVVSQNALGLDTGAEFHGGVVVVQDFVPLDPKGSAGLPQQVQEPGAGQVTSL